MLSSEDLERFYFQYQTEAMPLGISIQTFCLRKDIVSSVCSREEKAAEPVWALTAESPSLPLVCDTNICGTSTGNGLHIIQKDLDYQGLRRLVEKLEELC